MGQSDFYAEGDYNAICYVCGFKFKASTMRRHWQGYYVCERDWEPRHPQDFVRSTPDVQTAPYVQPLLTTYAKTIIDIPWTAGGATIASAVLTDYITTLPTAAGDVLVNIPDDVTLTGATPLSPGTGWPSGTTFIVNNSGDVHGTPDFTGFTLQWNGNPYG